MMQPENCSECGGAWQHTKDCSRNQVYGKPAEISGNVWDAMVERLAEQDETIERLRAAIRDAPHDNGWGDKYCAAMIEKADGTFGECDCWKRKALEGE